MDIRVPIEQLLDKKGTTKEPFVLRRCAEALGQIGTLDSLPVLERHLRDPETRTRTVIRRAIAEIRDRHAL